MSEASGRIHFGMADYVMLGLSLAVSMVVGIFFAFSGNKQRTRVEYLLGSRTMSAVPVCLSLFASFQSAIALLGTPAEVYRYGTMAIYSGLGATLSQFMGVFAVVPLFYPLHITSLYEYLEHRFQSKAVRLLGTIFGVLSTVSYMTVALLSPALALQTVAEIPLWLSVVLVGLVGTVYTTLGGMRSVVWTDVIQTVMIFGGIIFISIKGIIRVGGFSETWAVAERTGRIIYDDINPDPRIRHTVWGLVIGNFFYWTTTHFSQPSVQRVLATKTYRQAQMVFLMNIPVTLVFGVTMILTGLILVAYFEVIGCDPLAAGYVTNSNQLMPYYVMHTMGSLPGLAGIYISSVFAGALSTLSSGINSLAAITVEDLLGGVLVGVDESTVIIITKTCVFAYGFAVIGLAYLAKELTGPVTQITYSVLGTTGGPVLGLFLFAAIFSQAEKYGALGGTIISMGFCTWISVGKFLYGARTTALPPGSTTSCEAYNETMDLQADNMTSPWSHDWTSTIEPGSEATTRIMGLTSVPDVPSISAGTFSLFDISYVWMPLVGLSATMISGLLISLVVRCFKPQTTRPPAGLLLPGCYSRENSDLLELKLYDGSEQPSFAA